MWSCSRRTLILSALPLAACGFEPAYGTKGPAKGLMGRVEYKAPTDKRAFDFVESLEERLGRPQTAAYLLTYEIDTEIQGQAITTKNATTRYDVLGKVRFALIEKGTGRTVTSGLVQSFTGYSASGTTVSTRAQENDAIVRLMRILADEVVTRLVAATAVAASG